MTSWRATPSGPGAGGVCGPRPLTPTSRIPSRRRSPRGAPTTDALTPATAPFRASTVFVFTPTIAFALHAPADDLALRLVVDADEAVEAGGAEARRADAEVGRERGVGRRPGATTAAPSVSPVSASAVERVHRRGRVFPAARHSPSPLRHLRSRADERRRSSRRPRRRSPPADEETVTVSSRSHRSSGSRDPRAEAAPGAGLEPDADDEDSGALARPRLPRRDHAPRGVTRSSPRREVRDERLHLLRRLEPELVVGAGRGSAGTGRAPRRGSPPRGARAMSARCALSRSGSIFDGRESRLDRLAEPCRRR